MLLIKLLTECSNDFELNPGSFGLNITFSLLINQSAYKTLLYHYVDGLKLLHDDEINKYWKTIQKNHN